jgi:hypothetical protein
MRMFDLAVGAAAGGGGPPAAGMSYDKWLGTSSDNDFASIF